ncbi:pisatin demethylase [Talaromyces proteolyticus]|uniref:Pisatin demethylase n=1 Tax=Talaromyces proteolyticus TaxID=1131652 RepID=A0AAD4PRD4_9EURO|nr:pisatin demethylase [Talaromyces proteolyticus]KAH8688652.1 pisatin demethylase [Talaromyces proteolyticus]
MYLYLAAGLCAILVSATWRIISNVFLSPLASIPGPFLAKITSKWLILVEMSGNRTTTIHKLHNQYGPTVRVGPNEVSFADGNVIKELYGQSSDFMKAPVYDQFSQHPVGIFSMQNKAEHRERRKLLSHAFAQSNLLQIEPVIGDTVKQLLKKINGTMGQPTDALVLLRMFALDVVGNDTGELFLGKSFSALESIKPPTFIRDLDAYFIVMGMKGSFPWLFEIASYFPSTKWQELQQAPKRLRTYGENALRDYRLRQDAGPKGAKYKDLLHKMLTSHETVSTPSGKPTEVPMTDEQISLEIGNLVFAGTDTTSTTLTYLFWQLAQCKWQELLRDELAITQLVDGIATFGDIDQFPILNAVIAESLRLFPAAPASLQRETPAGGRELAGYFIPAGTVVSMQCYTTQRDGAIFHDPETFDPTRWMQSPEKLTDMNLYQMPFSKGTRACLGKNLAMMELKLVVAAVIKQYQIKVADSMKPGDMNMKDHFLTLPACGRCDLVFTPL